MDNQIAADRPAHRVSSFSDADSLLAELAHGGTPPVRPTPTSTDQHGDLQTTVAYLRAVASETATAGRFHLAKGECAVVSSRRPEPWRAAAL